MKIRFIFSLLFTSLFFLLVFVPGLSVAQSIGDPAGDPDVPIDGGLTLLIAAGVGYGVKKIRDERKKHKIN